MSCSPCPQFSGWLPWAQTHRSDVGPLLSPAQIAAIRAGLLQVVPQPVLDLLTWQQLEKKICGDPEITVAELRKFSKYQDQPKAAPSPPHGQKAPLMMLILCIHSAPY